MEESSMVLESARKHLEVLAPLATELNSASDAFGEELKAIEAELSALNLGIAVTLDAVGNELAREDDVEEIGRHDRVTGTWAIVSYLGFARWGDDWRLLVREFKRVCNLNGELERCTLEREFPLLEASRELRLAAAERIDDLLKLIQKHAVAKRDKLNSVVDKKR